MDLKCIIYDKQDGVAVIRLNRPQVLNAMNKRLWLDMQAALDDARDDEQIKVVVITGEGRAFSTGADLKESKTRSIEDYRDYLVSLQEASRTIIRFEKPTIAAINGWAMGTGLELAMACTMRVAAKSARMGQPEVKLGITPGAGGTQRLPRLVGMGLAMEMILTGDPIPADRALAIGLVNRMADTDMLDEEALELARKLAARPKQAMQYAKEAVLRYAEGSLAEGLAHESYLHALSCGTEDKKEGIAAFLEKRDPVFSGR